MWQTDRSRYMAGWDCEWRRLLGNHAFGTGLSRRYISTPLAVGTFVHSALQAILKGVPSRNRIRFSDKTNTSNWIAPALTAFRQHVANTDFPVEEHAALIEGIAHAYSRIALPWLIEEFDIIQIEKEGSLFVTDDDLEWMYRPDFVTRHKKGKSLAIHDFKTSSSWNESRDVPEYQDNIQMMMNAYGVSQQLGEPVTHYYIHILLKGNDHAPSPLIKPYCRPGNPPLQKEDWQAYYKYTDPNGATRYLGKSYSRVNVWENRPVADWIWEMPDSDLAKQIIIVGPYEVNQLKIDKFIRGLQGNEESWKNRLAALRTGWANDEGVFDWSTLWAQPGFQYTLDSYFPRTYRCYTYGSRCPFYELCHQHDGWTKPLQSGLYEPRVPHHEQERIDD